MKKLANHFEKSSRNIIFNQSYWSIVTCSTIALFLVACGDNVTNNESVTQIVQEHVTVVSDVSELPECTTESEGEQAFVKGESVSRICVDGSWQVLFSAAVDKQNELKCSTESLADGNGVKILCNGDSIGVLLNGVDGANGKSAYEIAKAGGYKGTEAEWLESLNGADGANGTDGKNGANGKSAYEIAKAGGYTGTEAEWLESLKGADGANGTDGKNGANGKSAYEIAKAGGYTGTEAEWLESLKGADGANGTDGKNGSNGKSAYEIAKAGGYVGTETEWLESLKGTDGKNGMNGKSAYEIAKDGGYTGTETEWLESLKGTDANGCFINHEISGTASITCGEEKVLLQLGSSYKALIDMRDKKSYRTILIGKQRWMAENLNYDDSLNYPTLVKNSWCYDNLPENCEKYGRLYSWPVAMDSSGRFSSDGKGCGFWSSCTPTYPVRGICPEGWHLPAKAEFETLISVVGGDSVAGKVLKSPIGWKLASNGSGSYGFDALPAGGRSSDFYVNGSYVNFAYEGDLAIFWTSTVESFMYAYGVRFSDDDSVTISSPRRDIGFSVRCLQD